MRTRGVERGVDLRTRAKQGGRLVLISPPNKSYFPESSTAGIGKKILLFFSFSFLFFDPGPSVVRLLSSVTSACSSSALWQLAASGSRRSTWAIEKRKRFVNTPHAVSESLKFGNELLCS